MEANGQIHIPTALPPGKEPPSTHRIGGWVGPRAGLDAVEKIKFPIPRRLIEPPNHNRPARSQSLYRLNVTLTHEDGSETRNGLPNAFLIGMVKPKPYSGKHRRRRLY